MTGKVHTILGVSTVVALAITNPTLTVKDVTLYPAIGLLASVPGSLLPDIDIQQSKMGQKHKFLSKHLTHRGITHTLLFPAIIAAAIYFLIGVVPFLPDLLLGFEVAYVAHIFADMFNSKGVPLLWPLTKAKFHLASVQTRSKAQQVIYIIIWEVALLIWILITYKDLLPFKIF